MNPGVRGASGAWRPGRVAMTASAIVLIVAACGSTNPPSANPSTAPTSAPPSATLEPTASPSPSPSPSPSADVGSAFIAKVGAFGFAARSTVAGELDLGSARYAIDGTFDVSGVTQHRLVTVHSPQSQPVETIYAEGVTYARTGSGPWYVKKPTLHDSELTAFFKAVKTVTDTGVETKNGSALHHLTLPAGTTIAPSAFGMTDPSISGVTGSVEFWAAEDGSPAVMGVQESWQQQSGGATVSATMALELTFSGVGSTVSIVPPADVWTTYASSLSKVTFGYPQDWDLFKNLKSGKLRFDEVAGPGDTYAEVYRYASLGYTANEIVSFVASNPDHVPGFHVDGIKTVKVAGLTGRQMRIHATFKGKKRYWIYTFGLKGSYFYEVDVFDNKGHEADDLKLANEFAASMVIR